MEARAHPVGSPRELWARTTVSKKRELSLGEFVRIVLDSRWRIIRLSLLCGVFGLGYILLAVPLYRADAVVQLELNEARSGTLTDKGAAADIAQFPISAELQVVKSRAVLGRVVTKLGLDISVDPVYFPVIGRSVASRHLKGIPGAPLVAGYAWGGETCAVSRLDVLDEHLDRPFTIEAKDESAFSVYGPEGDYLGEGRPGELFVTTGISLVVQNLQAQPGTRFEVKRRPVISVVEELQEQLRVVEEGVESRIIKISLDGYDREWISAIVNAVAEAYMERQAEWRSKELDDALAFLEDQKSRIKLDTEKAEAELGRFRQKRRAVSVEGEAERLLDRVGTLEARISQLETEKERYLPGHPGINSIEMEIGGLKKELGATNDKLRRLPETQREASGLSRDASASAELYSSMINDIHRLRLMTAVSPNNIKVLDTGDASYEPVRPRSKTMILGLSLILGALVGIVAAVWRWFIRSAVSDPSEIEENLKLPVYAVVAFSEQQTEIARNKLKHDGVMMLATKKPNDPAIEALRGLRAWFATPAFALENRTLLVTGPSEGVGKSFVCGNLAAVLTAAGKRVLLIDGDLRKGAITQQFCLDGCAGLSDLLAAKERVIPSGIHASYLDGLHVMPRGTEPVSSAELLLGNRLSKILGGLSDKYDYIIIDSPPVLPVADAVSIGQSVGGALMVVRQGVNTLDEIHDARAKLHYAGVDVKGFIVNGLTGTRWKYGYAYGGTAYGEEVSPKPNVRAMAIDLVTKVRWQPRR